MSHRITRYLFIPIWLILLVSCTMAEQAPALRVTFLDVGQGDSILIRTPQKTILLDAGDDRYNVANAVIIPYFKKEGIRKIDTIVISHPHRDHFGGFLDVLHAIPVGEVLYSTDSSNENDPEGASGDALLYMKMLEIIKDKNIPYRKAEIGMDIDWGTGVKVEMFHAEETLPYRPAIAASGTVTPRASETTKLSANDHSLIFKMTAGNISYLFTGDAERVAEANAVSNFSDKLKATVLKSGHHGSKTSSGNAFMEVVKPEYGIISVGAKNSFGHPNKETLDKYAYYKMKVFRTDLDGTVDSYTDGKTIHFISNQSALEFTKKPQVVSLTANSATIQWSTNKLANSGIRFGITELGHEKVLDHAVNNHTMTISGLKPDTTYKFQAFSVDDRVADQVVTFDGTVKTPAGQASQPKIAKFTSNDPLFFVRRPFKVQVNVTNPAKTPSKDLTVSIYHSAAEDANLLGRVTLDQLAAGANNTLTFPIEITWQGPVELLAVLSIEQSILDTASLNIEVNPKTILVDCSHENIEFYTGKFAGMKMDLFQKGGFGMKSASKGLTADQLKGAFILIITDPRKEFSPDELTALKDFVTKGGSLLLYLKSDYKNLSQPALLNTVLNSIGSNIRFNDDQFCDPTNNIGAPFRPWVQVFPSAVIQGVQKLLLRSACTLLNRKMEGLTAGPHLELLATGDGDSYNCETDGLTDGYIYASHTPKIPIPVAACEDLGLGRVACVCEALYADSFYDNNPQIQTPQFNRSIISWLALGRDKSLKELLRFAMDLDTVEDPELRAMRFENVRDQVLDIVNRHRQAGNQDEIDSLFREFDHPTVQTLYTSVEDTIRFQELHSEPVSVPSPEN